MFKYYDDQDTTKDFVHAYGWILETKEFASFMQVLAEKIAPFMGEASIFVIPSSYGSDHINCAIQCNKNITEEICAQVNNLSW